MPLAFRTTLPGNRAATSYVEFLVSLGLRTEESQIGLFDFLVAAMAIRKGEELPIVNVIGTRAFITINTTPYGIELNDPLPQLALKVQGNHQIHLTGHEVELTLKNSSIFTLASQSYISIPTPKHISTISEKYSIRHFMAKPANFTNLHFKQPKDLKCFHA